MKRIYQILAVTGISLLSYEAIHTVDTQVMKRTLTGAHTRAFSQDNLFSKRLEQSDLNAWISAMKGVSKFVEENNSLPPKDKVLSKAMTDLNKASDSLINALKITYNTIFSSGASGGNPDTANVQFEFIDLSKKVSYTEKALKREKYVIPGRKNAQEILLVLCLMLETTATKASKDLEKQVEKRFGK